MRKSPRRNVETWQNLVGWVGGFVGGVVGLDCWGRWAKTKLKEKEYSDKDLTHGNLHTFDCINV